ncbi:GNAT family N-acetyltransferase [Sediminicoccus sp. BL-A-41-H5]|uniref:GNAT family N-acetyltransferase n=1 Tax=Sediminicoccus sp. BL-A-41-H5 TaxID=3421106 RepID=UPI003D66BEFF
MTPILTSERLTLREFRAADFEPFAEFWASEASRFVGGPMGRPDAWRRMAMYAGHRVLRGYGIWVIEARQGGAVLGQAGLWFPEAWPEPEIHWTILPSHQGQGYATEAARAIRRHARDNLGFTRLVSCIEPANDASIRVALRLGAVREGSVTVPPRIMDLYRHNMDF